MIENMSFAERQEYETQKEYASGNHFRLIYNEKGKTYDIETYEVKEVIVKPSYDDIKFLERICNPARSHSSIRHLTIWEAIIPSIKNHMLLISIKIMKKNMLMPHTCSS